MKYLPLIFLIPNMVYAQWDFGQIEILTDEANELIREDRYIEAFDLYRQIDYLIRINEGLYSIKRLPYLLDLMEWNKQLRDWEEVSDKGGLIRWLLGRNEPNVENFRKLLVKLIDMPVDRDCMEKEGWIYNNNTLECVELRLFLADSYISAVEVQQSIVGMSETSEEWLLLSQIAEATAEIVYGVDGPPIIYVETFEGLESRPNPEISPKYMPDRYLSIANDAKLESTVCCDSI